MKALTNSLILILCCGFYLVACSGDTQREEVRNAAGNKEKQIPLSEGKNKLSQEMLRIVNILNQVANVYDQTMHVANTELKAVSGKPKMKSFMKFLAKAIENAARGNKEQGNMKTHYHELKVMSYYGEADKCKKTAISFYLAKGELGKYPQTWQLYRFNCQNQRFPLMQLNFVDEHHLSLQYSIDPLRVLIDMGNFEKLAKEGTGSCKTITVEKGDHLRSFTCHNLGQAVSSGKSIAFGEFQFDREGKLKSKESKGKTYMIDARAEIFDQMVSSGTKTILVPLTEGIEVKQVKFAEPDSDQGAPTPPLPRQAAPIIPVPAQAQLTQPAQQHVDSSAKNPNEMQTDDMNEPGKAPAQPGILQATLPKVNCADISPEACDVAHRNHAIQTIQGAQAQLHPEQVVDGAPLQGIPAAQQGVAPQAPVEIVKQDADGNLIFAQPPEGQQPDSQNLEQNGPENGEGEQPQAVPEQQGSFLNPGQD
ncbi:MAG: hypothetical protein AB7H97_05020, partial [Pseudobdellovibrionaceae bacterium]